MPVLPGPCGLYRFTEWGTLQKGVMHEYFSLVHKPVDNIVFGNVQLAEDRIPSCLLVFRSMEHTATSKEIGAKNTRPRTGFVHDAVFYFEAEKPLGQLVKQRRRWLNGTYAAYLWVHREGWVWRGGHHVFTKLFAGFFVLLHLAQGAFVRLCGAAMTAIGIFALAQNMPEVLLGDRPSFSLRPMDERPWLTAGSLLASSLYLGTYAIFVIGHTPRAVPVNKNNPQGKWRPDKRSAYRPRLFAMGFVVNMLVVLFFLAMSVMVVLKVELDDIPLIIKAMVSLPLIPYLLVFMDCIVNNPYPDLTSFWNVIKSTPHYFLSSLWFSIWLPAYATARISDLSWGNRDTIDGQSGDDSVVAKHRERIGRRTAIVLICSNAATALLGIASMYAMPVFLQTLLVLTIGFVSILYVMPLGDMTQRILRHVFCGLCCMTKKSSTYLPEEEECGVSFFEGRTTSMLSFPSSDDMSRLLNVSAEKEGYSF